MQPIQLSRGLVLAALFAAISGSIVISTKGVSAKAAIAQPVQQTASIQEKLKQPASKRLNIEHLVKALDQSDVEDAIRQVELGWKKQFEDYYQGQLTSQYLSLEQMMRSLERLHRLTGKKTALVYAIPTPTHLELILVSPTGKPIHRRITQAKRTALLETAQIFRMGVVDSLSRSQDYLPAAKQLHQWLISPLEPTLKAEGIDSLIFCLGTGLRSLPMAALHDGDRFLVEKYSLGIIPAFNLLDQHPAVLQGVQVLAMGASEFQNQPPLPAVPTELIAVSDALWQGDSLLNQDFTVANLRAKRAKTPYGIVHLATHAEFQPESVNESFIQFWDRKVRINQLRELGLRVPVVQLLVLSACRTALGDPQAELGFAGLAVQSGSKAALASLWSVSDAGTLVLMTEFYRQLKTAPIKAEALRQAQLAMLKQRVNLSANLARRSGNRVPLSPEIAAYVQNNLSHPYYWAAFTMIGNPW